MLIKTLLFQGISIDSLDQLTNSDTLLTMQYKFETVIPACGTSFVTADEIGPVVDCVFHVHPEIEITYVDASFGVRFIGDNIGEFHPDDLVMIGSMLPHHYYNAERDSRGDSWSRLKVIKIRENFAGRELFNLDEFAPIRRMLDAAAAGISFSTRTAQAQRELIGQIFTAEGPSRVILLLDLLANLAASDYTQLSIHRARPERAPQSERMDRALAFIHSRLDGNRPLNLTETAKVACMTPEAFSRYFRLHARKRFIDYVNELRIGRACGLLASTDRTIMDIAFAVGFRNLSNFNRHFVRLKHTTPRDYRNRTRGRAA